MQTRRFIQLSVDPKVLKVLLSLLCVSESCDLKFKRMIDMLPLLTRMNIIHSKQLNNIKMTGAKLPELHEEVFDDLKA